MRYSELQEVAPGKDIRSMISTIALSLISSGRTEVNTKSLSTEIAKRTGIQVPYGVLMDILNTLPFVQDANSDLVTLSSNGEDEGSTEEEPDTMNDMAQAAEENGGQLPPDYKSPRPN